MKKYLKLGVFSLVVFASIFYGREANRNNKLHSAILLNNIEALATPENPTARCFGTGSVDCPLFHIKVEYVFEPFMLE